MSKGDNPAGPLSGAGHAVRNPEPELDPGHEVLLPESWRCPLVFSSPHSGNIYPARFLAAARLDSLTLRRSEDAFIDTLFAGALAAGAPLLRARFPRAFLDVNREPYELDPRMFEGRLPPFANTQSLRVAGGLGTIARIVGEAQEIYARRLSVEEAMARIEAYYKPYHHSLRQLLGQTGDRFGLAILVDCHSMPSATAATGGSGEKLRADVVIGDRFGASCNSAIADLIEEELRALGYMVQRNKPYAGGFITENYGLPGAHCHAVQIEVNRALYMDERTMQLSAGFSDVARDMARMVRALADFALSGLGRRRAAAE